MRTQAQLDLAWEVLTNCAKAKETITYRSLAARLGANISARSVGRQYLDDISEHCESNDAPDLSAIVVRTGMNVPGIFSHGDLNKVSAEHCKVFHHTWPIEPRPLLR